MRGFGLDKMLGQFHDNFKVDFGQEVGVVLMNVATVLGADCIEKNMGIE